MINSLLVLGIVLSANLMPLEGSLQATAPTSQTLNITTSTVAQDLEAFYHASYGDKILQRLVPSKSKGDKDSDFKFYHFYPYQGDLYFYFYAQSNFSFQDIYLEYSDGTTFNANQEPIENWHVLGEGAAHATIKSTYGKNKVFYKCVIPSFYTYKVGDQHRILLNSVVAYGSDEDLIFTRHADDSEFLWEDSASDTDLTYHYFKDNYIVIDQASYYQQWETTEFNDSNQNYPTKIDELNWLFFSWSWTSLGDKYALGALKKVVLDYEYLQYEAEYTVDTKFLSPSMCPVYFGTSEHPEVFTETMKDYNVRDIKITSTVSNPRQTIITPETVTIQKTTDTPAWWQFWLNRHEVKYTYNSIQALDDTSLNSLPDEGNRDFFKNNRDSYQYAIMMKKDTRSRLSVKDLSGWNEFWNDSKRVSSVAHELVSAAITTLTFNTDNGDAELNAIMDPVELTGVFTTEGHNYEVKDYTGPSAKDVLRYAFYAVAAIAVLFLLSFAIVSVIKFYRYNNPSKKGRK